MPTKTKLVTGTNILAPYISQNILWKSFELFINQIMSQSSQK